MLLFKEWFLKRKDEILSTDRQIKAWRKANRKMKWGISAAEFKMIEQKPPLTPEDIADGFVGVILNFGFGNDGSGNSNPVLSAKNAWNYAQKNMSRKTWQCKYIDFDRSEDIRLRPDAEPRPKGFYFTKYKPAILNQALTVAQFRKSIITGTGLGPEGVQLLAITHTHLQKLMLKREMPFLALADFDVAPHGFNDFYDAPQIFCSNDTLGLGIGNIDQNYPLFGIPVIRL